jgi:hypothetical protein
VGPCHHGMARPQVADGGTASDTEGNCELIEIRMQDEITILGLIIVPSKEWKSSNIWEQF